jgi:hypothetical protein
MKDDVDHFAEFEWRDEQARERERIARRADRIIFWMALCALGMWIGSMILDGIK